MEFIVSAIIPRPCDLKKDPYEKRVKDMNKELKLMSQRRNLQFLHTFRIFLHNNKLVYRAASRLDGGRAAGAMLSSNSFIVVVVVVVLFYFRVTCL